jgi:DNA-binding MarR family transcriptional regulator
MTVAVAAIDAVLERYQRLIRALQARRAALGTDPWYDCRMSLPQLRALGLIAASERGLSSRELATALGVGASAITPLVDRLVEHGFAHRTEDPHDRRIARLHATATGADLLDRMRAGQVDVIRSALAQLDPAELESVGAALELLHTGVQRAAARQ